MVHDYQRICRDNDHTGDKSLAVIQPLGSGKDIHRFQPNKQRLITQRLAITLIPLIELIHAIAAPHQNQHRRQCQRRDESLKLGRQ